MFRDIAANTIPKKDVCNLQAASGHVFVDLANTTIYIQERGGGKRTDFHAHIKGNLELWGAGKTRREALGNLVLNNSQHLAFCI